MLVMARCSIQNQAPAGSELFGVATAGAPRLGVYAPAAGEVSEAGPDPFSLGRGSG